MRIRNDVEIDRLKTSTRELYERENRLGRRGYSQRQEDLFFQQQCFTVQLFGVLVTRMSFVADHKGRPERT